MLVHCIIIEETISQTNMKLKLKHVIANCSYISSLHLGENNENYCLMYCLSELIYIKRLIYRWSNNYYQPLWRVHSTHLGLVLKDVVIWWSGPNIDHSNKRIYLLIRLINLNEFWCSSSINIYNHVNLQW
jgi:hypothetical protein